MTGPRYNVWRLTLEQGGCILVSQTRRTRAEFARLVPDLFLGHRVRTFAPLVRTDTANIPPAEADR